MRPCQFTKCKLNTLIMKSVTNTPQLFFQFNCAWLCLQPSIASKTKCPMYSAIPIMLTKHFTLNICVIRFRATLVFFFESDIPEGVPRVYQLTAICCKCTLLLWNTSFWQSTIILSTMSLQLGHWLFTYNIRVCPMKQCNRYHAVMKSTFNFNGV